MKLYRNLLSSTHPVIQDDKYLCGVAIGNFDGFHRGHRELVRVLQLEVANQAAQKSLKPWAGVLTFFPHPRLFFSKQSGQPLKTRSLISFRDKLEIANRLSLQFVAAEHFTRKLANLSAQDFFEHIIVAALCCQVVVVGEDWRFGKGREGRIAELELLAKKHKIKTITVPTVSSADGCRVSSSRIQKLLQDGDINGASHLLGAPYTLAGRTVHGSGRGSKQIGFPTANLHTPAHIFLPRFGVYAAKAFFLDGRTFPAVINIGLRPTFNGSTPTVEAHLITSQTLADFYHSRLSLELLMYIREERRFSSIEELKAQIAEDCRAALAIVNAHLQ